MGKKYIVELGRCERLYKAFIDGNGKPELTWLSPEIDLTPYTKPDLEQVRKEAYDKGFDVGRTLNTGKYEKGLNDAWDAARKIACDEGIDMNTLCTIFRRGSSVSIIRDYSASEAIAKIKEYEDGKQEIKVGDEVKLKYGVGPAIYMQGTNGSDRIYLLFNDGSCGIHLRDEIECKTGRHFPEIATVLEKMRGEKDAPETY